MVKLRSLFLALLLPLACEREYVVGRGLAPLSSLDAGACRNDEDCGCGTLCAAQKCEPAQNLLCSSSTSCATGSTCRELTRAGLGCGFRTCQPVERPGAPGSDCISECDGGHSCGPGLYCPDTCLTCPCVDLCRLAPDAGALGRPCVAECDGGHDCGPGFYCPDTCFTCPCPESCRRE